MITERFQPPPRLKRPYEMAKEHIKAFTLSSKGSGDMMYPTASFEVTKEAVKVAWEYAVSNHGACEDAVNHWQSIHGGVGVPGWSTNSC